MEKLKRIIVWFKALPKAVHMALLVITLIIVGFYFPIGMILMHKVDDNLNYDYSRYYVENGSESVAAITGLIDREVNQNHFTPNDPFFVPSSWLERMPAFQRGILGAVSRFTIELADQIARTRGSSQMDSDLEKAAGLLKYSPYVWVFDFKTSVLPTASAEKQYRAALKSLINYNQRLASGNAVFERRTDNLLTTLDRISNDLGSVSASIDNHVKNYSGRLIDTDADLLFYETKGRLYAYYIIMKALRKDFDDVITERDISGVWDQTLESLAEGAELSHFLVINGSPGSGFVPNHLTSLGFYLMRSRTQLREISSILQN